MGAARRREGKVRAVRRVNIVFWCCGVLGWCEGGSGADEQLLGSSEQYLKSPQLPMIQYYVIVVSVSIAHRDADHALRIS